MNTNNFILTTLSQNPEYFEEVIQLIEEEFHYNKCNHYEKDFALLVDPQNFDNCFIYIDSTNNTIVAHLGICLRTLVRNNIETQVGLIGGIVTHKKYRGRNLFKDLMDHVLSSYGKRVSLFILWSDIEGMYERFLFYRTGGIIESGKKDFNSNQKALGYEKTSFHLLAESDFDSIKQLYHSFNENNFLTLKREEKDWSVIRNMNSIDLFIKRSINGEIKKYFCINKGKDLTNIIHEISCRDFNEYNSLLKEIGEYKIWLPETENDKFRSAETFYTALIRIGNVQLLNQFLMTITKNQLSIVEIKNENAIFNFRNKDYDTSSKELLQFIFGPKPLEEFSSFKLSLYITGIDSI